MRWQLEIGHRVTDKQTSECSILYFPKMASTAYPVPHTLQRLITLPLRDGVISSPLELDMTLTASVDRMQWKGCSMTSGVMPEKRTQPGPHSFCSGLLPLDTQPPCYKAAQVT